MITKVKVNGFRSLTDFELDVQPGLNILVGPNGSGKTNIITFFEFLSYICEVTPLEAVNRLGGAGCVFTRKGEDEIQKQIDVEIHGCVETNSKLPFRFSQQREKQSDYKYLKYLYSFRIEASSDFDSMSFTSQHFQCQFSDDFDISSSFEENIFSVNQSCYYHNRCVYEVKNIDEKIFDKEILPGYFSSKAEPVEAMQMYLAEAVNGEVPLVKSLSKILFHVHAVNDDLKGGQVLNIIPSRAKEPEKSSSGIGIANDGSGLSATLHAIKKLERKKDLNQITKDRILFQTGFDDILKYLAVVNTSFVKIDVVNDPDDNLLKVKFWIEQGNKTTMLPISSMSDGTIKWLALVTAVLTSPSIFSIEEPENFLHPLMQSEVVKLMRNATEKRKFKTSFFMSTHSETILNSADVSEIIIVNYENYKTQVSRCSNQEEIRKEIRNTGFGLGYYYCSESLER